MARRSANDGTVIQTDNGRWAAVIELPRRGSGKRQRRWRRARTKNEAQRLLREMRDELQRTGTIGSGTRTVGEAIDKFLADRPQSDHDDWALGVVRDGLGTVRLAALTVPDCDDFLTGCATGLGGRNPVGRDHLARIRQRLIGVLRNEMRVGNLGTNVAELSELPVVEKQSRERRALTVEELHRVLDASAGSRLIIVDLCGRNGLRPAEARALRWEDLNLSGGLLSVTGQMNRRNKRGPVKRASNAFRTIPLDQRSLDRLDRWQAEQERLRAEAGTAWQDLDHVASTRTGTPIDRFALTRSMASISRRADLDPGITAYELRHTAISHQADAGRTSWEIADWAGTSEAMISSRYRHRLHRVSGLRPADNGL